MKTNLTNLFNSSVFRHVQRLAVLCLFLSYAFTATAGGGGWSGTAYGKAEITSTSTGEGSVYVNQKSTPSDDADDSKGISNSSTSATFWWHAVPTANSNSAFAGWFKEKDASGTVYKSDASFSEAVTGSSDNTNPSTTYYAHFKKIITPRQAVIDWTKTDEEETLSTTVDLYNAENFSVHSVVHNGGQSRNFTCTITSISDDYTTLTLTAGSDVVSDDQFVITLVANNGGRATITVNIKTEIKVTFVHPSLGKGSYKAVQTSAGGTKSCNIGNADTDVEMSLTNTAQFYHTFTATPHADYNLYRWVITHEDNSVAYFTENPMSYTLQDGDKITAEFLPKNMAQFMVKGEPNVYYHKLEDAIAAAQSASSKTVVVYTSGTLYNEHIIPSADGKYELTIPSDITLLVPGDAAYTVAMELREDDLSNNTTATPTCYKYLTIAPNTRLIVNGKICVYSQTSHVQGYNGKPNSYGKIDMKDQTEIELNDGSQLTVFGYITGDPTKSRVLAKKKSKVIESFQFTDWPGGTKAITLIGNSSRVFPIKQFYIQSIETKLTLQNGAEEYVAAGVSVSKDLPIIGKVEYKIPLNMIFVAKDNQSDDDRGFLCLGEGVELSKWYDGDKDRQVYEIKRMEGYSGTGKAKFGIMYTEDIPLGDPLNSEEYVLATNNNMDISLYDVQLSSVHDFALMADTKMYIAPSSEYVTKGNLFVYDEEVNDIGFFGTSSNTLKAITYTAHHNRAPGIRGAGAVQDAQIIVDGKLTVQSGGAYGSGFYTTVENPLANNLAYGAKITSNGGGLVDFQYLGKKSETYQYRQVEDKYISIPVSNARLRNGDNSYSAGDTMTTTNKYYYYKDEERWLIPQFGITNPHNNEFTVTLPEAKQQNVICNVTTAGISNVTKNNFTITLPSTTRFTYAANSHTYVVTDDDGTLTIPLTYNPVNIDNTGLPYTETMTVSYTYYDPIEKTNKKGTTSVTLTANENYMPDFTVVIGEKDVTADRQYTFAETVALNALLANVVITPVDTTVAKLPATVWQGVAAASPTFTTKGSAPTGLSVVYTPQTAGDHTGTLTITATYKDAANHSIPKEMVINLNGIGRMQDNTLAFQQELIDGYTIDQGSSYQNIFANMGNSTAVTFTCTYVGGDQDGQDASELVTVSAASGNYTIKANEVASIAEARQVKVVASQEANGSMNVATREIVLTVALPVIWNWSDLYFGQTYTNPVTTSSAQSWTLEEVEDPGNMVGTLQGNYTNYSTTIATGDVNMVYEARFKFVQRSNVKYFTSKIYADPRILGFCVDAAHKYKGVTLSAAGGVSFDDTNDQVSLNAGAQWVIQMIGTPDKITFTTNGENTWNIEERASASSAWRSVVTWANLGNGNQSFQLLPTTGYVRITYGSANPESIGQLSDICISKLSVKSDMDEIYLPIHKDGSASSKKIVLTHTEATTPNLSPIAGLAFSTETTSNLGTVDDPYYQTKVTITAPSTFANGTYTLTATQGTISTNITIYADYFPQGLPIKLATDDTKRYHFIATAFDNVSWDAAAKQVVMKNPGGSVARSVVFAFEGAPSRISFTASRDIIDSEWRIYESIDGTEGSFVESGLVNRDKEAGSVFTHNLQYTTRYVRIYYYSENQEEVRLSDLVIEGDPMLLVNPEELEFSTDDRNKSLTLTAINLNNIRIELDNVTDFQMSHGAAAASATYTLSSADYPNALGVNKVGDIVINTEWITNSIVNDGMITIYNVDANDSILAKVKLVGAGKYLHKTDAKTTGLYTGIPDGTRDTDGDGIPNTEYKYTYHGADYTAYQYHPIDLSKTFADDGTALFDYLFVYGETTTTDTTTNITAPAGESGSNARTPYYVYIRDVDAYGNFDRYRFVTMLDNANIGRKDSLHVPGVTTNDSSLYIKVPDSVAIRVYITGFCPYASTGADKFQEGVFFFRGMAGSKLDVYLENAQIFARNKMLNGQPFYTRGDSRNPSFTEGYARGSGGVLVFENIESTEDLTDIVPFDVTIHTTGNNLLKSNYGCFNYFFGMDPFQISAPIHVRLHSKSHVSTSKTVVNFTDEWPTALNADRSIKTSRRTNGFLSLQKLNNNAPSIDLGNPLTEVNFRGGQVELQNAQIVSENYKTTLAISYRSGEYGGDKVGLKFASGIGTDSVGGSVNFYDGTITIQPMWVAEEYKNYYMIDKDVDGNEIRKDTGKKDEYGQPIYEYQTTCLRTPKNTNVYGGSICWLRACQHVTSKGGAPSDGTGKLLGQYVYEFGDGDTKDATTGLVTKINFPDTVEGLRGYYDTYHNGVYGIESVTPDAENKLYFWIPDGYGGVEPEKDNILTTWKACMTEISAGFGTLKGTVGGRTPVEQNEEIKYMLYCKIDENISNVITAGTGDGIDRVYSYNAPVKVPPIAQGYVGSTYMTVRPSMVGMELQNEVASDTSYLVTDRVYYVTNATADLWQTFTAPFDVEKIWVVETFSEEALKQVGDGTRDTILISQAHHNADFAAFFGVSMAIGTTDSLGTIFNDFVEWGKLEDQKDTLPDGSPKTPLYNGVGDYTLRGRYKLIPYYERADGTANWAEANFYLNENKGNWQLSDDDYSFITKWEMLTETEATDGVLLEKGKTYSMMFPYCTGCGDELESREYWDYWSGKFLIFESTDGTKTGGHIIDGSNLFDSVPFARFPESGQAIVSGNGTFAYLETSDPNVYTYQANFKAEMFMPNRDFETQEALTTQIMPTTAFLWTNLYTPSNVRVRSVARTGEIDYVTDENPDDNGDGTITGGHIPTVGGGNDLFITSTATGVNIAVAAPQNVRVLSSTGAVLYSGMVQTAVDVVLPTNGVYVVTGENEAHKILY